MTITKEKVKEIDLKKVWKPASAQIRHELDSTTFKNAIKFDCVPQLFKHWTRPIIVARHTHADMYDVHEMQTTRAGILKLKFEPSDTSMDWNEMVHKFDGGGVFKVTYNTDESIKQFAHNCFLYALQ